MIGVLLSFLLVSAQFKLPLSRRFTKVYPLVAIFRYQQTHFSGTVTWVSSSPWTVKLVSERNFIIRCFPLSLWSRQNRKISHFGRFFRWLLLVSAVCRVTRLCSQHQNTIPNIKIRFLTYETSLAQSKHNYSNWCKYLVIHQNKYQTYHVQLSNS